MREYVVVSRGVLSICPQLGQRRHKRRRGYASSLLSQAFSLLHFTFSPRLQVDHSLFQG